jgi:hypothetical protein
MSKRDEKFKEYLKEMLELHNKKSHDYAKNEDKFSNFKMCEELGICTTEEGFIVRITDKVCRISQLLKKTGRVQDEKITDTLLDLAIYSLILREYIETEKDSKFTETMSFLGGVSYDVVKDDEQ